MAVGRTETRWELVVALIPRGDVGHDSTRKYPDELREGGVRALDAKLDPAADKPVVIYLPRARPAQIKSACWPPYHDSVLTPCEPTKLSCP